MSGARCATRVCLSGASGGYAVRSVETPCLPRMPSRCTAVGVCAAGKGAHWWLGEGRGTGGGGSCGLVWVEGRGCGGGAAARGGGCGRFTVGTGGQVGCALVRRSRGWWKGCEALGVLACRGPCLGLAERRWCDGRRGGWESGAASLWVCALEGVGQVVVEYRDGGGRGPVVYVCPGCGKPL